MKKQLTLKDASLSTPILTQLNQIPDRVMVVGIDNLNITIETDEDTWNMMNWDNSPSITQITDIN